ncbi:MAG: glycosyltransferase family 39 protein, partial [Gaiellaceae bacterium]
MPTEDGRLAPVRRRVDGFRLGVGAITAGLAGFLLLRLHALPPHEDETLAFFVSRGPLHEVLETVLGERGGAPLHYLLAHAVGRIDPGLTGLRLVSVAFAVGSMPVVAALAARLTDRWTALCATLLTAVSWTTLYHGIYARMYSLFLFTSALSLLLLLRALERGTRGRWALWAAATLALLATQPYGVLVLAAEGAFVALVRLRRPVPLRVPLAALAAVVVLAGPLWRTYFLLASRFEVGLGASGGSELGSPLDVVEYLWNVLGDFTAGWLAVSVPVALVALLGFVVLARTRRESALLMGAAVVVTLIALVAARSGAGASLETRHLIFLLPFFATAFAVGLLRIARLAGGAAPVVAVTGLGLVLAAQVAWGLER